MGIGEIWRCFCHRAASQRSRKNPCRASCTATNLRNQRCLIPADGFYTWKAHDNHALPYYVGVDRFKPFAFAGIWQTSDSNTLETEYCSILTTRANSLVAHIQDRMPMILSANDYADWLDSNVQEVITSKRLYEPFQADRMAAYAVGSKVIDARNDYEELIIPLDPRNQWPHLVPLRRKRL
jgi:putative SOS response-associated peptidase YedK